MARTRTGEIRYRTLSVEYWNDRDVIAMPGPARLMYLYLITSGETNDLGVGEYLPSIVAFQTGVIAEQDVTGVLEELQEAGKLLLDGKYYWVRNFVRLQTHAGERDKNRCASRSRLLTQVKSAAIRQAIVEQYPYLAPQDAAPVEVEQRFLDYAKEHGQEDAQAAGAALQAIVSQGQSWDELKNAVAWGEKEAFWQGKIADLSRLTRETPSGTLWRTLCGQYNAARREGKVKREGDVFDLAYGLGAMM